MTNEIRNKMLDYLDGMNIARLEDFIDYLNINKSEVKKYIKILLSTGKIEKIGTPPDDFYMLNRLTDKNSQQFIDEKYLLFIENNYLCITPAGEIKSGIDGFTYMCLKNNYTISDAAKNYYELYQSFEQFKIDGMINGKERIYMPFTKLYLDELFYGDFYAIEKFGKTKMGELIYQAKHNQDKQLMQKVFEMAKPKINFLIKKYNIDCVAFIPPTIKREVQIMDEMRKYFDLDLPHLSVKKVKTGVAVPQKSLRDIRDRIENARRSIVVDDKRRFDNILIIDDAVGSGASMNETAAQLKLKHVAKNKVIGFAFVGSFKGFDIISEV